MAEERPPWVSPIANIKGTGKHKEQVMFDCVGGSKPYVWIGDSDMGCYIAVTDLRSLRKMKEVLDHVVAKRTTKKKGR